MTLCTYLQRKDSVYFVDANVGFTRTVQVTNLGRHSDREQQLCLLFPKGRITNPLHAQ